MGTEGSTQYDIREATAADVADLIRMQIALQASMDGSRPNLLRFNKTGEAGMREYYLSRLQDKHTQLLIARITPRAKAVGMGMGRIWLHPDYRPSQSGEVVDIWVDPEHRRRNLALRLVRNLVLFFQAHHIDLLVVDYVQGNTPGERLWQRLGFQPVLVTASAERAHAETALGIRSRSSPPSAYRSVLSDRRSAYPHSVLSG